MDSVKGARSVPIQDFMQQFLATIPKYPMQGGSSLNAGGINYQTLKAKEVLGKLQNLEPPRN